MDADIFGYDSSDDNEAGSPTLENVSNAGVNKEGATTDQNSNPNHANDLSAADISQIHLQN